MSEHSKEGQTVELTDDSLAYEHAQVGVDRDDPLAAIKRMRLEQLAVCRLKAEE